MARLAAKLRTGLVEAAYAIHTTTNHNMINAIEDITVNEGIDPRESYLISGGGATACHIAEMARILGIKRYMVPKLAAGLSAYGGLLSDVRWEKSATLHQTSRDFDPARVARLLCRLRAKGDAFLAQMGFEPDKRAFEFSFQGRYLYQSWDIEVAFEFPGDAFAEGDLAKLLAAFHRTHERIYTIKDENDVVEFTTWKLRAIGNTGGAGRRGHGARPRRPPSSSRKSRRPVYLGTALGMTEIPVYDGQSDGARHDHRRPGPHRGADDDLPAAAGAGGARRRLWELHRRDRLTKGRLAHRRRPQPASLTPCPVMVGEGRPSTSLLASGSDVNDPAPDCAAVCRRSNCQRLPSPSSCSGLVPSIHVSRP